MNNPAPNLHSRLPGKKRPWGLSPQLSKAELDRKIAELTRQLESKANPDIDYQLAQLLRKRNEPGDVQKARTHASRAVGPDVKSDRWVLLAQVEDEVSGVDSAMQVIRKGKETISAHGNVFAIYQAGAKLLVNAARSGEALALLQEGIGQVPPEKSLFSLFEAAADIHVERNELELAVQVLREGTQKISPKYHLTVLYQKLGLLYCRAANSKDAILSQIEGYRVISNAHNGYKLAEGALFYSAGVGDITTINDLLSAKDDRALVQPQKTLGTILVEQLSGNWTVALDVSKNGRETPEGSRYAHFASLEALSCLALGNHSEALKAIASFPNFQLGFGLTHTWLVALSQMRLGKKDDARNALSAYLGRAVDKSRELNEAFLLRLWYQQATGADSHKLCFQLPVLPALLSGLDRDVRRIPFANASQITLIPKELSLPDQPSRQYGDYKVETTLGSGGAGEVFKGRHKDTGDFVALKVMNGTSDPRVEATFRRELNSLNSLTNAGVDGVIKFIDFIREDEHTILVLELADGGNLESYVDGHPGRRLGICDIKRIGESLVETMVAVHTKNIIHRDLKPANILLVGEKWKIADFGISKVLSQSRPFTQQTLLGAQTEGYSAPEQVAGKEASIGMDIFSIGKVLLFMANGTPDETGIRAVSDNALRRLIKGCLAHNPEDRPTSMLEVKDSFKYVSVT